MIQTVDDLEEAIKEFTRIIAEIKKASSQVEVSELERQGVKAMRELQLSAAYIGRRLKQATDEARTRIRLATYAPAPVEKPVPKSAPKKATKKTARKK